MYNNKQGYTVKDDSTLKEGKPNSDENIATNQQEGSSQSTTAIPKALSTEDVEKFERSTAICVKSDVYHGESYSIVLHPTHGEVVLCHQKVRFFLRI